MSQGDNKRPKTKSLRRAGRKFQASEAAGAVLGDNMVLFGMGYEGHNIWACDLLDNSPCQSNDEVVLTSPYPAAVEHLCSQPQESCAFDQGYLRAGLRKVGEMATAKIKYDAIPFCFTFSNDTTKSDNEPGKAVGTLPRCCGTA